MLPFGVLGLEDGPDGVDRVFRALDGQLESAEKCVLAADRPLVGSPVRLREDRVPGGRGVEPVGAGLVEGRPEDVVGDGFRGAREETVDPHPLLPEARFLFREDRIDGPGVLIPIYMVADVPGVVAHPGGEIEAPPVFGRELDGERPGRSGGDPAGTVRPEGEMMTACLPALALDTPVGLDDVGALGIPRKIEDHRDLCALRESEPAEDGLFILARPFQGHGVRPVGRLDPDGRVPAHPEGQAEIESQPGVLSVRRVRADLRDEEEEVGRFGDTAVPFHPETESEGALTARDEDESGPRGGVEAPDINVFPGIEDLRGGRPERQREQGPRRQQPDKGSL